MSLRWFTSRMSPEESPTPVEPPPNAEQAWKALGLIVDWIKHAETKAAATIAGAAADGVALYNLVKDADYASTYFIVATTICGTLALCAGLCAGIALWPRLRSNEPPTSLLYFQHIARAHPTADGYVTSMISLTKDIEALVTEIARQGWANSRVAHRKYIWGARAIACLLLSLAALATAAAIRLASPILLSLNIVV
ncbi:Pycsar system effector family protein [Nonomuraea sp. NPDC048892]|uniref:Pycsar system effector family protein n=1 Tax=Nonomuraea sp. NPDC048892 TaxID=3154624 RepID=UPI0033CF8F23